MLCLLAECRRAGKAQPGNGRSLEGRDDHGCAHLRGEDLTRTEKLRIAARVLIKRGVAGNGGRWGLQSRLAEHFGVTRQRVSQIVRQEINSRDSLDADSR